MIQCKECELYFFSNEGRQEHNKWCIGKEYYEKRRYGVHKTKD